MPRVLNKYHDPCMNAVSIMRPSKFGNPFIIGVHGDRTTVCDKYELWIKKKIPGPNGEIPPTKDQITRALRGEDLLCCCAPSRCHGDFLLLVANRKFK